MIRRLYPYMGQYKQYLLFCLLLVTGEVFCEMMMPLLMARIVDQGIPQGNIPFIAAYGALMVLLALTGIALGTFNSKLSAEASQGFAANIRQALFNQILSFSFSNIDRFSGASLITRLTSDITQLQTTLLLALRLLLRAPLMLISAILFAMSINLTLSLVFFFAAPLLAGGVLLIIRSAEQLFTRLQQRLDNLNGMVQENLIAIRVVKAFVREAHERIKFKTVNDALTAAALDAGNLVSLMMPLMFLIINSATIAIVWFGGKMVAAGALGTGEMISFISYLMQIMMSILIFSMVFILLARAEVCAKRILEVAGTQSEFPPVAPAANELSTAIVPRGKIEFRQVKFSYHPDEANSSVLDNISFSVEPGQFVAIIGGTGSGKTTLVSLIPRLYEASGGQILLDGIDVRSYSPDRLRSNIGVVLQKNTLFSGTIRENLKWGNPLAGQNEIEQAARVAQAHDFIAALPQGYDTWLGQGGVNLSGGQKQRLCIARAIVKKPAVLILDDSTSAVDTATEKKIRQAFDQHLQNITVLLIAQRISSVKDADKIIVLDGGKLSAMGSHQELLATSGVYREICNSQQEGLVS